VLVECCVALMLLSVCSTLVLLGATGTATLVDGAQLENRVQEAASTISARVQLDACAGGLALPALSWGPRLSVLETHLASDSVHRVAVTASWQASAMGAVAGRTVAVSTAGVCE
jgi:hypothetical protein